MINCILLVLLLLVSMVLLKCTNSPLVIHFLNFVQLFHIQVLLIIILLISFAIFFYLAKITIAKIFFLFFKLRIKNAHFSRKFPVFYDVASLFTNIILQETIDIGIIFSITILMETSLKKNFFATSQTHFIFSSKSYNQIDGVAMDSPLAPVLANIFMGFWESKWLHKYNFNKLKF